MKYINPEIFSTRDELRKSYQSKTPFRYLLIDNFLNEDGAKEIHEEYPAINDDEWDGTTYLDQKNKFQREFKNACVEYSKIFNFNFIHLVSDLKVLWGLVIRGLFK